MISRFDSVDFVVLFELGEEAVAGLLGVAEQHGGVLVEKDWVVHSSVADTKRPLHNHDLVRLPHPEQRVRIDILKAYLRWTRRLPRENDNVYLRTGIPAMIEFGSSSAAELTVSLAPMTRVRSVSGKSSLISSISSTLS